MDILASLVPLPASNKPRVIVGFAAESQDLLANAARKLAAKKLDLIVANDISARDAGFGVDTNRVTFLFAGGRQEALRLCSKEEVADELIRQVSELLDKKGKIRKNAGDS